jgi:general secretion pathway protein C
LTGGDASNCDDDAESAARVAPPVQTGPSRFQVTRGLIDQQLARLSALSTETFVMPGLDNAGKLSGFKLGSIRPDNVLYSLGLRNGDVLVAINGKSLIHDTSLDDLLALRKSSQVKLTLRRKGVQRDLTYDIAQK